MQRQIRQTQVQASQRLTQVTQTQARMEAQISQMDKPIADIGGRSGTTEPGTVAPEPAAPTAGEVPEFEVTGPRHPLAVAVLEAEASCEREGWGQRPRLFALVEKAMLAAADPDIAARLRDAPDGSLIPVEQEALPDGEPSAVLASVFWPADVTGCVLATETIVLPPEAEAEAPPDPAQIEQWAGTVPGGEPARLAVGVARNGQYTCVLRLKEKKSVQLDPRLADDLVAALLETL